MKQEIENYFTKLLEITLREKEAERKQKDFELQHKSLKEKRKQGLALYPIEYEIEPYPIDRKLLLNFYPKQNQEISLEFKEGITVKLYDLKEEKNILYGVIQNISKDSLTVIFSLEEIPNWLETASLVLEIYYDEFTYEEIERVLNILKNPKEEITKKLISILLGKLEPSFNKNFYLQISHFNDSQNEGLNNLLNAENFALLHGPPGTGKTEVILEFLKHILKSEQRVLLTAPSNTAVDLLTKKCKEKGFRVVRIGNLARIDSGAIATSLDFLIQTHPDFKNVLNWKEKSKKLLQQANKYKRNFTKEDQQERKIQIQEARELSKLAQKEIEKITKDILEKAEVITCTLSNLFQKVLKELEFQTVIVDECSQALEPLLWFAVFKTKKKVLFSGDSKQLPPTTFSVNSPFQNTLFEKLLNIYPNPPINNFLNIQYRMHPNIVEFSNIEFYDKKVKSFKSSSFNLLSISKEKRVLFIDTAGTDINETWDNEMQSYFNEGEINILLKIWEQELSQNFKFSVGILSPYSAQTYKLKQSFSQYLTNPNLKIEISTIDSFQGSERDIIFLSLVRSNENKEIGFLNDYRRMNVAITRAKEELLIIGNSETICSSSFYTRMLNYVQKYGKVLSAWEFL